MIKELCIVLVSITLFSTFDGTINSNLNKDYIKEKRIIMIGEPVHGIRSSTNAKIRIISQICQISRVDAVLMEMPAIMGDNIKCQLMTGTSCDKIFSHYDQESKKSYLALSKKKIFNYFQNNKIPFYGFDIYYNDSLIKVFLDKLKSKGWFSDSIKKHIERVETYREWFSESKAEIQLRMTYSKEGLGLLEKLDKLVPSSDTNLNWLIELTRVNFESVRILHLKHDKSFFHKREIIIYNYINYLLKNVFHKKRIVILSSNFHVMKEAVKRQDFSWNAESFGSKIFQNNPDEVGSIALLYYKGATMFYQDQNVVLNADHKNSIEHYLKRKGANGCFYRIESKQNKKYVAYPFGEKVKKSSWIDWYDYFYFEVSGKPDTLVHYKVIKEFLYCR